MPQPGKVIVLGGTGMLGSMVVDCLSRDLSLMVSATARSRSLAPDPKTVTGVTWHELDAASVEAPVLERLLDGQACVVNAIGVIKPYIHDDNPQEVERAIHVNSVFPYRLRAAAAKTGSRVVQIATDCVYSGQKGKYAEKDTHDALDVYGKSKSLGEARAPHFHHLRVSIIGPEPKAHVSLLDWFLRQKPNAEVNGFTNHSWNGVTTLHYAKLCHGIVAKNLELPHLQHVIPRGTITKCDLLSAFARSFQREDITIHPMVASTVIDRTLATSDSNLNVRLWAAAGYTQPPTIPEMVAELAAYDYRFRVNSK